MVTVYVTFWHWVKSTDGNSGICLFSSILNGRHNMDSSEARMYFKHIKRIKKIIIYHFRPVIFSYIFLYKSDIFFIKSSGRCVISGSVSLFSLALYSKS